VWPVRAILDLLIDKIFVPLNGKLIGDITWMADEPMNTRF
jgi:hypothetical protein